MNYLTSPIMILDGETRTALAVVRSLGRYGYKTIVVSNETAPLAGRSRFAGPLLCAPDPNREPDRFINWLEAAAAAFRPALIFPLTDVTVGLCSKNGEKFGGAVKLPLPPAAVIEQALNKDSLLKRAAGLGIAVPETIELNTGRPLDADIVQLLEAFSYPAVLKPAYTAASSDKGFVKFGVKYPRSAAAVIETVEEARASGIGCPLLLQERITGMGIGVFALCWNGKTLLSGAHRRLLEKPPSGGVSVLCESIPLSEAPADEAQRLLADLNWSGAAMVEFKLRDDGRPVLMEINPRFWGSLQLMIDSGLNLPVLLARIAAAAGSTGLQAELAAAEQAAASYRPGRRLRWLLGTADHLLIRVKGEGGGVLKHIVAQNELRVFERPQTTKNETFRLNDPLPAVAEFGQWLFGSRPGKSKDRQNRRLKILQFIETGGAGGAERVVSLLVRALLNAGHEVEAAGSRSGWLTETLAADGIRYHSIPSTRRLDYTLPLRLSRLLQGGGFDILHSHLLDSNFYGSIAGKLAGVAHLATEHGDVHHPAGKKLLRTKLRIAAMLGSQFSSVSNFSAVRLCELGVPARIITRIPNPVRDDFFSIAGRRGNNPDRQRMLRGQAGLPDAFAGGMLWLHAASIRPVKDQETLLRGFALSGPNQFLAIVGEGEGRSGLARLAADLGIAQRVHFAGFSDDIPSWLEAADGFILSSKSESMPMALLEAGAAGLLLASSDVGGVREVIPDDEFGFLFPSGDPAALAKAIDSAAAAGEEGRRMVQRSMSHIAANFSMQRIIGDYVALYNSFLI